MRTSGLLFRTVVSIAVSLALTNSLFAWSECITTLHNGANSGFNFVYPSGSGAGWDWLNSGMSLWKKDCGDQAPPMQRSTSSQGGLINIDVSYMANGVPCDGSSTACGCGELLLDSWGNITGGSFEVFNYNAAGGFCGYLGEVFAHEIGHVLGFGDSSCNDNIMGPSANWGLTFDQCSFLDMMFNIENEDPCDDPQPPLGCDNGQDPPGSPIVIDLARDGFRFTSPHAGVEFDLDSDGTAEQIAWVGDPQDAFLFRDLNGNGLVDDGGELFGNYTVLLDGSNAAHGFEAIIELDLPGQAGNGDGVIDERDWGYHLLELWVDSNLNGISEAGELVNLTESPVRSISLNYHRNRRQDKFGNLLTYWSKVRLVHGGKVLPSWAVDVFFQQPSP